MRFMQFQTLSNYMYEYYKMACVYHYLIYLPMIRINAKQCFHFLELIPMFLRIIQFLTFLIISMDITKWPGFAIIHLIDSIFLIP